MLGLQSRDKWRLNICDAIEIQSKGFDASSVIIQYVQNFTTTLKLRSALFSWLVWVVFLAMRKVTALQVALHHRHDGYANPERVGICTWTLFSIAIHHSSLGRAVNNFSTQIMTSARMTAVRYIECDFFIQQSCYETTCTIRWIIQSITCSYLHVWFLYLTVFSFMHTWWWYLTLVVYLETVMVSAGPNFLKCVCIFVTPIIYILRFTPNYILKKTWFAIICTNSDRPDGFSHKGQMSIWSITSCRWSFWQVKH